MDRATEVLLWAALLISFVTIAVMKLNIGILEKRAGNATA